MRNKLLFASTAVALGLSAGIALADQGYFGFPVLGTPANTACATFVNGVCSLFQGPSELNLTGLETVPADTNIVQGQAPQSIEIPVTALGAGLISYQSPLTGATITTAAGTSKLVLTPAATIAAQTVVLPPAAGNVDGATFEVGSSQVITALTFTAGAGNTLISSPTTIAANGSVKFVWRASNASWYVL